MSINSRLKKIDGKIVGELVPVSRALDDILNGGERVRGSLLFHSMERFKEVVDYLKERRMLADYPPYLELLVKPRDLSILPYNWSYVPESTMDTIMPHQVDAINAIVTRFSGRAFITLPPGKGKTLIGCLSALHYGTPYLIICPASKTIDWQNEMHQWTGLNKPIKLEKKLKKTYHAEALVSTFETAKNIPEVVNRQFSVVIVDECHMLKNDCQRTKEITKLLHNANACILMSGTPQENRPSELFNQLHILYPRIFTSRQVYTERYSEGHINKFGKWDERGAKHLDELSITMDHVMFRGDDTNILDVNFVRHTRYITPTEEDADKMAKMLNKQTRMQIQVEIESSPAAKLALLDKIERFETDMWAECGRMKAAASLAFLDKIISKHSDEKIAIFVYHGDVAEVLCDYLDCTFISGATKPVKRAEFVNEFNKVDDGPRIAILSMDALGDGINLSPGVSVIVCFELHRKPTKMQQVEMRAYRYGAKRDVTSYWCILNNSHDEQTLRKLQSKAMVNSLVLNGNKKFKFIFDEEKEE